MEIIRWTWITRIESKLSSVNSQHHRIVSITNCMESWNGYCKNFRPQICLVNLSRSSQNCSRYSVNRSLRLRSPMTPQSQCRSSLDLPSMSSVMTTSWSTNPRSFPCSRSSIHWTRLSRMHIRIGCKGFHITLARLL